LALTALVLTGPALAAYSPERPAQPLAQGPVHCALGIAPLNRRCHVIEFAKLGAIQGRDWYYAFYSTRWADRHGSQVRGFPIVFYRQHPATLRLGLWINDAPGLAGVWGRTPPPRPTVIRLEHGDYLGFTLKAVKGQDEQRLFRLEKLHWGYLSILYRTDEEQALIDAATPKDCKAQDEGVFDWPSFTLRTTLKSNHGDTPCGVVVSTLQVRGARVYVVRSVLEPAAGVRVEKGA
jgi:hypothetical protein